MLGNYQILDRIFRCSKYSVKQKLQLEAVSEQFNECSRILWRDVTEINILITDLSVGDDKRELHVQINDIPTSIGDAPRAIGSILERIRDHKLQNLRIDYYSTEPAHEADIQRIEPLFQEFLKPEYGQKLTKLKSIACEGFFYNQPEISKLILRNSSTLRRLVINPGHNDLHNAVEKCAGLRSLTVFQTTWLTYFEQRLSSILSGKRVSEFAVASARNCPIPRFVETYVLKALASLEKPVKHLKIYCQSGNSLCPLPSSFLHNDRSELRILSGIRTLELCRGFNSNIFRFCPDIRRIVVNQHDVLDSAKGAVWVSIRIESYFTTILQDVTKKLDRVYELEFIMRVSSQDSIRAENLMKRVKEHFGTENYTNELVRDLAVTFFQGNAAVMLAIDLVKTSEFQQNCSDASLNRNEDLERGQLSTNADFSCNIKCSDLCCSHLRCLESYHL